jgi:S-adenosylmethionine uptake transporter
MNAHQPKSLIRSPAILGALFMILAGIVFAAINVLTQWLAMVLHFPASSMAFWQYAIATAFSLPLLIKLGIRAMRTRHPIRHLLRVVLAALGVQAWAYGLVTVPIWQAIALVMTSPFFVIIGARLFLGETVGLHRWSATAIGFTGAMIILQPWADSFSATALLPVLAALLWGGSSLIMKNLTHHEPAETVTIWLFVLLTPINAALAFGTGFALPQASTLWLLVLAGFLTAIGQYLLTLAYSVADAAYVQPFDDLKLPLNVLAGWVVFGYAPSGYLWLGALLILGASLSLMLKEARQQQR